VVVIDDPEQANAFVLPGWVVLLVLCRGWNGLGSGTGWGAVHRRNVADPITWRWR
jgi:hypothetical protein